MSIKVSGSSQDKGKSSAAAPHATHVRGSTGASVDRVGRAQTASFLEVVDDMESRQIIDELDEVAAQLTRFPTTELVRRYRELVRAALDKVRSGMQIRREFKWRRTERAMYITIEKTEGLVEELEEVLMREGDRARGLSLVDEIKGCLISLLF